jgi:hypothetical protein
VSEYDHENSIMRMPWPTMGYWALEKTVRLRVSDQLNSFVCVLNYKSLVSVCMCVFILVE